MGDAVTITVWQQDAEKYGAPHPLLEEGFVPRNPMAIFEQGTVKSSQ